MAAAAGFRSSAERQNTSGPAGGVPSGPWGDTAPGASLASSGDHFHSWQPLLAISDLETAVRRILLLVCFRAGPCHGHGSRLVSYPTQLRIHDHALQAEEVSGTAAPSGGGGGLWRRAAAAFGGGRPRQQEGQATVAAELSHEDLEQLVSSHPTPGDLHGQLNLCPTTVNRLHALISSFNGCMQDCHTGMQA